MYRSQAEEGEYSLIVDYTLYFQKETVLWYCHLVFFALLGPLVLGGRALSFIHPVFVLPDAEPFDQILGALKFGMKTVLLTFEPSHVLHRHKYHLLLTVRVFGFDLQLLYIHVSDLWSFPGAPALVGFEFTFCI